MHIAYGKVRAIIGYGLTWSHSSCLAWCSLQRRVMERSLRTTQNLEEVINVRMKAEIVEARLGVAPAPFAGAHRRAHRLEGALWLEDAGQRAAEPEPEQE